MTVADLRAHVEAIAAEHNVRLTEHQGRAHAHTYARYGLRLDRFGHCSTCGPLSAGDLAARIRPVRSTRSYIVALHELGHLLSPRQYPYEYGRLEREVDATHWAWLHSRTHSAVARDELDHLSIGYIERYPSWPRPPADSHAWRQIADLSRNPTTRDRKALTS